jgi:hypothetical protein
MLPLTQHTATKWSTLIGQSAATLKWLGIDFVTIAPYNHLKLRNYSQIKVFIGPTLLLKNYFDSFTLALA